MNETIKNLIETAGFSNTYEQDRLQKLCTLVATVCIDHIVNNNSDSQGAIADILADFSMSLEDE